MGCMEADILGGGIGGLATAAGLTRAGWRVRVHERAAGLSRDGTGLGIWPKAMAALDRLGLGDRLRELGSPQRPGTIRRWDGRRLATVDTDRLRRRTGEGVSVVARPDLLGLLFAALPDGTVRFGTPAPRPGECDAQVVIGADGAHSATRRELFGRAATLRTTGLTVWRGVVDLDVSEAGEVWGPGAKFGFTPLAPGRTNLYAVLPTPAWSRDPGADAALLEKRFGDWPEPVPGVLRQADVANLLRHELHYLGPALPSYVRGTTALLGDAAHAMTPDLGQGACQALLDGLVLSRCLAPATNDTEVRAALREYDRLRRRPTQRIALAARWLGRVSVARRGTPLRDAVIRAASAVA
ncbi:2-polyprenyl-6-methoxyphenol hydroxylase [Saccharomonospora piscinae]|uniref:2-polyprenyl-6-methoxyphenol hydroxylase n=2 Tax=Saccharomonospora piscinae TaxID=687388 RepID=A0A1V9ABX1_SACPI|nr:2-polyprenyl-6-methoxyphenol hydroxylase [Saccharomonospora piscinae]